MHRLLPFLKMYTTLCLTLLSSVCVSLAGTPEYNAKFNAVLDSCSQEYKLDKQEVIGIAKGNLLPETRTQMCYVGCLIEKMDYAKDLTVDWEKVKADNSHKFDNPELVEKANQVVDACSKVVTEKVSDICDLGLPVAKCLLSEAVKIQMPLPDVKID